MSVNLTKGQKVNLSKEYPGLSKVIVGLGWEAADRSSSYNKSKRGLFEKVLTALFGDDDFPPNETIDCDSSVFLLKDGKLQSAEDKVWYGNLQHYTKTVLHQGDNLVGSSGDKDDEQIIVNLAKLPQEYDRLVIVVNIYQARAKSQHFGKVRNAYVRLVDSSTNKEMCRYNLTENYDGCTAMIFSELYRHNGEWKFSAIGQGTNDDTVADLARRYQ